MFNNCKFYIYIGVLLCLAAAVPVYAQTFTGDSWSNFSGGAKAVCGDADIDNDDDGLIELCHLEDVNAIRHNLNGTSLRRDDATLTAGCKSGGCNGYELVRDLDFNDDDSYISTANKIIWTSGKGWQRIGGDFNSILEGNGHTISHLYWSGIRARGFLENILFNGVIRNLGLSDFRYSAKNRDIAFSALADGVWGRIINSFTTGSIENIAASLGQPANPFINSLTASNAKIQNSYAYLSITNSTNVQGFIREAPLGSVSDSYIRGVADNTSSILGGFTLFMGAIRNTYSAIEFMGDGNAFYCVREDTDNNYWDTTKLNTSGVYGSFCDSNNVPGFSTVELQESTPSTDTTAPYYNWSEENWDFGTSSDYPAVKYAAGDDVNNPACGTSQQPLCDTRVRGQNRQPRIIYPTAGTQIAVKAGSTNVDRTIPVIIADADVRDTVTVSLFAEDENQTQVELVTTNAEVLPNGNAQRDVARFQIRVPTAGTAGTMTDLRLVAQDDSGFDNTRSEPYTLPVVAVAAGNNNAPTITSDADSSIAVFAGSSTTVNIVVIDADNDLLIVDVTSNNETTATAEVIATNGTDYTIKINGISEGTAMITAMVDDGRGETNSRALKIIQVDVEVITANEGDTVTIDPEVSDANMDDLEYAWRVMSGDDTSRILQDVTTNTKVLSFKIPDDYIEDTDNDSAMHELIFELKVTENKDSNPASTTQTVAVTITKIDNDVADLDTITADQNDNNLLMFSEIDNTSDSDGEITTSTIMYQWQLCVATTPNCLTSDWTDISEATDTSYNIDESSAMAGNRYRMEVTYTDGQGYTKTLYSDEHTYTTGIRIRTKVYLEGPLR